MQWYVFTDVDTGWRLQVPKDAFDFALLVLEEVTDFPGRVQLLLTLVPRGLSLGEAMAVIRHAIRIS